MSRFVELAATFALFIGALGADAACERDNGKRLLCLNFVYKSVRRFSTDRIFYLTVHNVGTVQDSMPLLKIKKNEISHAQLDTIVYSLQNIPLFFSAKK